MPLTLSSMSTATTETTGNKNKNQQMRPPLSTWGEDGNRQFSHLFSGFYIFYSYSLFLGGSMLPLIAFNFTLLFAAGYINVFTLKTLATIAFLDYAIPITNGYRPNEKLARYLMRAFTEGGRWYFPARSVFLPNDNDLSKEKAYILASFPHGLIGGATNFGFYDFYDKGFYPLYSGASIMKFIPITRRIMSTCGTCDVSKQSLLKVLDVKRNGPTYPFNVVHLLVGGINEMFYTNGGAAYEQIVLSKRKGFIKLALETGCDIIPQYSFGANQAYIRPFGPDSLLCKLSALLRISTVVWFGRWWIPMGIIPFRVPILTVTGPVFHVPQVDADKITNELVSKVHGEFCIALKQLFDEYKIVYVKEMGAPEEWLTRKLLFENEK